MEAFFLPPPHPSVLHIPPMEMFEEERTPDSDQPTISDRALCGRSAIAILETSCKTTAQALGDLSRATPSQPRCFLYLRSNTTSWRLKAVGLVKLNLWAQREELGFLPSWETENSSSLYLQESKKHPSAPSRYRWGWTTTIWYQRKSEKFLFCK